MAKKSTPAKKPATKTKPATKEPAKKPGVIASMVEFLTKATKTKPLTKEQLLARLTKRFPGRAPESMARTIGCQLGARIERERGVKLHKSDKGYWIGK